MVASTQWGVDSIGPANGTDTFQHPSNTASAVYSFSGGQVSWWGRYFLPSPSSGNFLTANAGPEISAMKFVKVNWVFPITSPQPSRLNGSAAWGAADAQETCDQIWFGMAEGLYHIPGADGFDNYCYVYLDVETGDALNSAYWNAWSATVWGYSNTIAGITSAPFYPAIYMNVVHGALNGSGHRPCAVVQASPLSAFVSVDSSEPENVPTSCASPFFAPYGPEVCAGQHSGLWQYAEAVICAGVSGMPYVDLDRYDPSGAIGTEFMLALA
jgi:hypothetical protein